VIVSGGGKGKGRKRSGKYERAGQKGVARTPWIKSANSVAVAEVEVAYFGSARTECHPTLQNFHSTLLHQDQTQYSWF